MLPLERATPPVFPRSVKNAWRRSLRSPNQQRHQSGSARLERFEAQWGVNKVSPRATETLLSPRRVTRAETAQEQEKLNSAEARRNKSANLKSGGPQGPCGFESRPRHCANWLQKQQRPERRRRDRRIGRREQVGQPLAGLRLAHAHSSA
jgi:hypothetical protein